MNCIERVLMTRQLFFKICLCAKHLHTSHWNCPHGMFSSYTVKSSKLRETLWMQKTWMKVNQVYWWQECIPVGCEPPTHWPYLVVSATHAPLPCMPLPAMHAPAMHYLPATHTPCHACPPAMHVPLPYMSHCHTCSTLPCTPWVGCMVPGGGGVCSRGVCLLPGGAWSLVCMVETPQWLLLRTICILLECILVALCFWYIVFLHRVLHVLVQYVFLPCFERFWYCVFLHHLFGTVFFEPCFGCFWFSIFLLRVFDLFGTLYFCFMFCYSMLFAPYFDVQHLLHYVLNIFGTLCFCTLFCMFLVQNVFVPCFACSGYRPQRSFGQGNIFTPVCHSFCSQGGGGLPQCMLRYPPSRHHPPEQTPPQNRQSPPRADTTPPPMEQIPPHSPPEQTPPEQTTPQSRDPPEQTPSPPGADTAPE